MTGDNNFDYDKYAEHQFIELCKLTDLYYKKIINDFNGPVNVEEVAMFINLIVFNALFYGDKTDVWEEYDKYCYNKYYKIKHDIPYKEYQKITDIISSFYNESFKAMQSDPNWDSSALFNRLFTRLPTSKEKYYYNKFFIDIFKKLTSEVYKIYDDIHY